MIRLRLYLQLALLFAAVALASWLYFWWVTQQTAQSFLPGPTGYNGEYAQALLKGQLHLKDAPPQMAQLADPYDPAQYSPFYSFDLSYYQGRIYSYFGVVPPLLLFLPWRLLTGSYPTDQFGTGLFMTLGLVLSIILLVSIRRRFLPNSPVWTVVLAVIVLAIGNQSLLLLWPPYYCQTVQSAARCLQLAALIASFLALTSRRQSLFWFSLASTATGLMVCTRPSFLLASALLIPIWLVLNRRALEHRGTAPVLRAILRPLAAGVLPIALIAFAQMGFNYARFDSPIEFGTTYQQFGIDLRNITQFSPAYMPAHILIHLFSVPEFLRYFPFLVYDEPSLGALVLLPFSWLLLGLPLGWRALAGPERTALRALALALVLAAVGNLVMLSGYYLALLRHQVDIVLPLSLAAAVGLLSAGHAWRHQPWRRRTLLLVATILVAANVTVTVGTAASYPNQSELPRVAGFFNRPVYFWETLTGQKFTNTLRLTLTFPTAPASTTEELLSLGADKIDAVFVRYLESNQASLGFFHTELGAIESRPFSAPPGAIRNIAISLGSMSPPAGHPAFTGWSRPSIDLLHRRLRIEIDGRLLLDQDMRFHPASPGSYSIGGNAQRPVYAKFSGQITKVSPVALTPVPPRPTAWPQGPLKLDAVFANRRVGRSEPLVSSGTRVEGDLLWVTYLDETHLQIVFDHGLIGQTKSAPISLPDTLQAHRIEILPDPAASRTVITLDRLPIITLPFLPFPAPTESVFFGIQTFPAACEPIFGGRIELVPAKALPAL